MITSIEVPKANPNLTATGGFQFLNQPMLSQYLESEYSIFGNPAYNSPIGTAPTTSGMATPGMSMGMPAMGMGMGYGMGFGLYGSPEYIDRMVDARNRWTEGSYDIAEYADDRQTKFVFKQQGNSFVLNTNSDVLKNLLVRMNENIRANKMRQASDIFTRIYTTIEKQIGIEHKTHEERVNAREQIKAAVVKYYEQINQSSLTEDIRQYGDSEFANGFKKVANCGLYNQNSAEETIAFMTDDKLQDTTKRKVAKGLGGGVVIATPTTLLGYGIGVTAGVVKGAKAGKALGGKGAIVGAIIGAIVGLIGGSIVANAGSDKRENLEEVTTY